MSLPQAGNKDYKRIYELMMESVKMKYDRSYTIIEEKAEKNMPEILKTLRKLKGARGMSQTTREALGDALRTLEFPGNELSTQVSNVFFFMSVWSHYS